ncbi:FtsH protease activity modulator HflK [Chlamydiia bacterium]|nr:FtsH protease activity modulator HflK [Chlamydiia bacterium]
MSNNPFSWNQGSQNNGPNDLLEQLKRLWYKRPSFQLKGMFRWIAAVVITIYILMGIVIIRTGEQAVVLRLGRYHRTLSEGLSWYPPLIDHLFRENIIQLRSQEVSQRSLTEDLNLVDIKLNVQYQIANLEKFILKDQSPELSLVVAAESAIRHVVGDSTLDDTLTTGGELIAIETQQRLQALMDEYQSGIQIRYVNLTERRPPREVLEAFQDVVKAREDKVTSINQANRKENQIVPIASGKAQAMKSQAETYKLETVAKAKGDTNVFKAQLEGYNRQKDIYKSKRYFDTMEDIFTKNPLIVVEDSKSGQVNIMNIDRLLESNVTNTK